MVGVVRNNSFVYGAPVADFGENPYTVAELMAEADARDEEALGHKPRNRRDRRRASAIQRKGRKN